MVGRRWLCDLTLVAVARTIPAISQALEAASPRAPVAVDGKCKRVDFHPVSMSCDDLQNGAGVDLTGWLTLPGVD